MYVCVAMYVYMSVHACRYVVSPYKDMADAYWTIREDRAAGPLHTSPRSSLSFLSKGGEGLKKLTRIPRSFHNRTEQARD